MAKNDGGYSVKVSVPVLVYGHVRVINVVTAGILIRACLLMRDLDINVICADSQ